jgi:hypothetical protein
VKKWVYGCPYYLISQFNICKHLIYQKGSVKPEYFEHLKRNHGLPFLIEIDKDSAHLHINQTILSLNPEIFKILNLYQEQKTAGSFHWVKVVEKNFAPTEL